MPSRWNYSCMCFLSTAIVGNGEDSGRMLCSVVTFRVSGVAFMVRGQHLPPTRSESLSSMTVARPATEMLLDDPVWDCLTGWRVAPRCQVEAARTGSAEWFGRVGSVARADVATGCCAAERWCYGSQADTERSSSKEDAASASGSQGRRSSRSRGARPGARALISNVRTPPLPADSADSGE